uniref:Uncharacterized protein n=1 Tax=Arundo donax TaxID=35708 RepID=A0A0A9GM77_ARUDO
MAKLRRLIPCKKICVCSKDLKLIYLRPWN